MSEFGVVMRGRWRRCFRLTRLKKRVFCSTVIGLTSDWLPSRRSLLSQRGAAVIWRDGHVLSGISMGTKGLQQQRPSVRNGQVFATHALQARCVLVL